MIDVRLLYPAEKMEAAARMADALGAAGYGVDRKAVSDSFPDLAAEGREARVLLLIWSRSLVSAAMADGGLGQARGRSNLIEVSVDGIEPALGAELSPVVLLSGWRGQPFHLGWQRILADVRRLCGSREGVRRTARKVGSPPVPNPAEAARPSKPARPTARAGIAAGALIAATLGAAAVLDRGEPDASPAAATRSAVVATTPSPGAASAARQGASPVAVASVAEASPIGSPPPPAPAESRLEQRPSAEPPARRPAVAPKTGAPKRLASASAREVKRYSRKHSKTMRLFCQRSGRSTPQCRSFARSMRALRG